MSRSQPAAIRHQIRSMLRAAFFGAPLVLSFVGCAGPLGPIRPDPPVVPPTNAFDGSYRNTIRVVRAFGSGDDSYGWCNSPGQSIITVDKGQFSYAVPHPNVPGDATPVFPATMKNDGSFYGEIVAGIVYGAVQGGHIQGHINGSACVYEFTGNRL